MDDPDSRAVGAAQAVAARYGVVSAEPRVLASGCSVVVHLAPAPVVARVPTIYASLRSAEGRTREIDLVSWLHEHGAAVVPPSDQLPPGPHEHDGLWMTFWRHVPTVDGDAVTATELAPHLAELHTIMRDYPGELPLMGPAADEIPTCLALLDRDPGFLGVTQLAALHRAHDRLRPLLTTPTQPVQAVHGDAFAGNTLRTPTGCAGSTSRTPASPRSPGTCRTCSTATTRTCSPAIPVRRRWPRSSPTPSSARCRWRRGWPPHPPRTVGATGRGR